MQGLLEGQVGVNPLVQYGTPFGLQKPCDPLEEEGEEVLEEDEPEEEPPEEVEVSQTGVCVPEETQEPF